jgi:hypothetical protein
MKNYRINSIDRTNLNSGVRSHNVSANSEREAYNKGVNHFGKSNITNSLSVKRNE